MKKIILDEQFARNLLDEANVVYEQNSDLKEKASLKAKIHGFNSQLEALTERLSQLPTTISPTPFFKQMEKVEALKKEAEAKLEQLKNVVSIRENPVSLKTFETFLMSIRELIKGELDGETKTNLIQKLVNKVRIKPDAVVIEYFVGERHFEQELGAYPPGSRSIFLPKNKKGSKGAKKPDFLIFSKVNCSNKLVRPETWVTFYTGHMGYTFSH